MFNTSNARYFPVGITEAGVANLSTGANPVAELDRRDLQGKLMYVHQIATEPNSDVKARIREDLRSMEESNTSTLSHNCAFGLLCTGLFYLDLLNNSGGSLSNFAYRFSYDLFEPTVADKIALGLKLSDLEEKIADEFEVKRLVNEEGSLPVPLERRMNRMFRKTGTRTVTVRQDITTAGIDVGSIYTPTNRFVALEGVAMEKPPDATYTTSLKIDVDGVRDWHSIRAWSLSGSDYDVPLFIPALESIRLGVETNTGISGYNLRYTYSEILLTDYAKVAFGLIPKEEKEDMWREIKAGVI